MPIPQDDLDLLLQQLKDVHDDLWAQSDNDFYHHRKEWQKVAEEVASDMAWTHPDIPSLRAPAPTPGWAV